MLLFLCGLRGSLCYPQLPSLPLGLWSFAALLSDGSVQVRALLSISNT